MITVKNTTANAPRPSRGTADDAEKSKTFPASSENTRDWFGLVAGRFQPLHLGHWEYILAAFQRCRFLYIGLTHPDHERFFRHATDPHRSNPQANPFSYQLRKEMLVRMMGDARITDREFGVVPVRLEDRDDVRKNVPPETVVYLTIYDAWGETKKELFESWGYRVEVLWRRRETVTRGHDVRARIREGREWHHLVPPATFDVVSHWLATGHQLRK